MYEIQKDKLYEKKYGTFENYLNERWGFSEAHGYRLVDSCVLYQKLEAQTSPIGEVELPKNESQVRELLKLETLSEQNHVWNKVVDTGERLSAKLVKKEVDEFIEHPETVDDIETVEEVNLTNVTSSKKEVLYAAGSNDECYTPAYAVKAIIPYLPKKKIIWCPFDKEDSHFVKELLAAGFTVTYSHIETGQDFYEYEPEQWDIIVSNPPFTNKRQIFERALSFNKPFALIMSNTWLNDSAPKILFEERELQLLMFRERMKFLNQNNSENKITFSSSYFCCDLLKRSNTMESLKNYGY